MDIQPTYRVVTGRLDLTVRFGQQVRYQCAKVGCRRYLKVADGRGLCGCCGTEYRQHADGRFTALTPQAVPA